MNKKLKKPLTHYDYLSYQQNPNHYYFDGNIKVIIDPLPLTDRKLTHILVQTPQEIEAVNIYWGEHYYALVNMGKNLWAGKLIVDPTVAMNKESMLLEMHNGKKIFYKTYSLLGYSDSLCFLSEAPALISQFDVFPKAHTSTFNVTYKQNSVNLPQTNANNMIVF